ncbi:hypothetical protein Z949_2041 [Sulfitobacter guttiformis KCTC 32187]|nr:hypothetical protein Z949_2041 [Sulfitobacter guttiformis KCTC 32187]
MRAFMPLMLNVAIFMDGHSLGAVFGAGLSAIAQLDQQGKTTTGQGETE